MISSSARRVFRRALGGRHLSTGLDSAAVREQFPAFAIHPDAVFCDGPGGSQVPRSVPAAMTHYLAGSNANVGGASVTSDRTLELVTAGRAAAADLMGCATREVTYGLNATSLTFHLSRSLARQVGPDDNVVVTQLDHDCNVGPWARLAADTGAELRFVQVEPGSCRLDMESLRAAVDGRTKLVACGYASNAVGTVNDVAEVVRVARAAGALSYVDAVHYAPHGLLDVDALGCDFLVCSAYKFFGPHAGLLFGRAPLMEELDAYRVRPATNELPSAATWEVSRWELGTLNYEGVAGTTAAINYLAGLGGGAASEGGAPAAGALRRAALARSWQRVAEHEGALTAQFLRGVADIRGVRLFGLGADHLAADMPADFADAEGAASLARRRTPTFAMHKEGLTPDQFAKGLGERGIYCASGNFYALGLSTRLGVEDAGGWCRLGFLHYNTADEVDRVLQAIEDV